MGYRRTATRHGCCLTPPLEKDQQEQLSDCAIFRPSDASNPTIRQTLAQDLSLASSCVADVARLFSGGQRPDRGLELPAAGGSDGVLLLHRENGLQPTGLIPQRQFHAIPEAKLVVNHAQIVLHDVLGG